MPVDVELVEVAQPLGPVAGGGVERRQRGDVVMGDRHFEADVGPVVLPLLAARARRRSRRSCRPRRAWTATCRCSRDRRSRRRRARNTASRSGRRPGRCRGRSARTIEGPGRKIQVVGLGDRREEVLRRGAVQVGHHLRPPADIHACQRLGFRSATAPAGRDSCRSGSDCTGPRSPTARSAPARPARRFPPRPSCTTPRSARGHRDSATGLISTTTFLQNLQGRRLI